jgi:predicted signal transduction protein with EAL and GGDEF domain
MRIEGRSVSVGTSVGVALYPTDGTTGERLLRHADTALYRAKREGRGTFRFFEAAADRQMQERHALEHDLGEALALGQLDLHYQPIMDCRTGRLLASRPSPGGTILCAVPSRLPSSCPSRRSAA